MSKKSADSSGPTFWLDLFTGTTWKEFLDAGACVSGFRKTRASLAKQIVPGDILLCYVTGIQRWVGALEVLGPSTDRSDIWSIDDFPVRFSVKPLITMDPTTGIPMSHLASKVYFYESAEDKGKFKGFVRSSPNRFHDNRDGERILTMRDQCWIEHCQ